MASPQFRAGVVIVVRRGDGLILAFERADVPGNWQLPQGGLEPDEQPRAAAWRELAEETGLGPDDVRDVAEFPDWTVYEYPPALKATKGRIGQAHRWFLFEAVHDAIKPSPDGSEFVDWQWVTPEWMIANAVEFRRAGYERVLPAFATAPMSA